MTTSVSRSKTRILVLHGFYDSAEIRQQQMKALIRLMKDIEFVFVNAPFEFVNYNFVSTPADQRYQWISYKPEWQGTDFDYDTAKESVEFIVNYINLHGPFDGLLGFSQGAVVCVAALLNIPQWSMLPSCIQFVILVGCPVIVDSQLKPVLENFHQQTHLPTLHVSGANDTLITTDMSEANFKQFNPSYSEFYVHKGGHYCPSDSDFRQKLKDFIQHVCHP